MDTTYQGKQAVLLTKHGKEEVIIHTMAEELGLSIELVNNFDTDIFGTFTRDVSRTGNQLEAAVAKARKGMVLTGLDIGIASEGVFTHDPFAGFLPWNYELVVLVDKLRDRTFVGYSSNLAQAYSAVVKNPKQLEECLRLSNFPSHGLVIRPEHHNYPEFRSGISSYPELLNAIRWATNIENSSGDIYLENDLRAFKNPTRMLNIQTATIDLIERIKSKCPACNEPGFCNVQNIAGLECEVCSSETGQIKANIFECEVCKHKEARNLKTYAADPQFCNHCNP